MSRLLLPGVLQLRREMFFQTYGTPYCGYSLRRLSNAYAGACLMVRRTNDNTDLDIGFKNGYVDTDAFTEFIGENSHYIRYWYDQSGNGKTMRLGQYCTLNLPESGLAYILIGDGINNVTPAITDRLNFLHNGNSSSLFFIANIETTETYGLFVGTNGWSAANNGIYIQHDDRSSQSKNNEGRVLVSTTGSDPVYGVANDILPVQALNIVQVFIDADNANASNRLGFYVNNSNNLLTNTNTASVYSGDAQQDAVLWVVRGGAIVRAYEALIFNSDKSSLRTNIRDDQNAYFSVY